MSEDERRARRSSGGSRRGSAGWSPQPRADRGRGVARGVGAAGDLGRRPDGGVAGAGPRAAGRGGAGLGRPGRGCGAAPAPGAGRGLAPGGADRRLRGRGAGGAPGAGGGALGPRPAGARPGAALGGRARARARHQGDARRVVGDQDRGRPGRRRLDDLVRLARLPAARRPGGRPPGAGVGPGAAGPGPEARLGDPGARPD